MNRKQWSVLTLALIIGALAAAAGAVVLVDPFEIYRKATAFIPPIASGTQSYSNAGVAKSYDYDSIIIGTSMTENFTPSQLDGLLGGRFVKLCINGGTPLNHAQMMDIAFATHDVRRVIYGVDIDSLTHFYKTTKADMPEYLYDGNLFNDTAYWFNQSVLFRYVPACLRTLGRTDPLQRDTMYRWSEDFEYGAQYALRDTDLTPGYVRQQGEGGEAALSQQSMLNVTHNILPYIEAHPDTEFIFFFTPCSLAQWLAYYQQGMLAYHLSQKEALTDLLLTYGNVRVFDFQANTGWILDLDNYVDASHYGAWINDAMAEAIARDEFRIRTADQVRKASEIIRNLVYALAVTGEWPDDSLTAAR